MVYKPIDDSGPALTPQAIQQLLASLQGGNQPAPAPTQAPSYQSAFMQPDDNIFGGWNPYANMPGGFGDTGNLVAPTPPAIPQQQAESAISRRMNGSADNKPMMGPVAPDMSQMDPAQAEDTSTLDAINALMAMAGQVPSGGGGGIDIEGIMKKAAGAAGAPFDAQIDTTRNQNQRAKVDTKDSSAAIRKMYNALGRSNNRAASRESEQSMAAAQQIQDMSAASADELSASNAARLNESAAQSAALGSGDLAATLAGDINANTSEAERNITETANVAATGQATRGEAERRYLSRQGQNLKLTGTNRAADLFGDLQDYLQGNRDKIGELRGQQAAAVGQARSSAAASAASAQSASAGQAQDAHQQMLENQMALLGMKTGLQQQDFENNLSQEELAMQQLRMQLESQPEAPMIPGFDDGMIEALPDEQRSALMLQQYLNPESGNALNSLMQNPALRQGFYTNEDSQQIPLGGNPLNAEQLLVELGLSSSDPQQNMILANIVAQLASGNTDLPYGAQMQR